MLGAVRFKLKINTLFVQSQEEAIRKLLQAEFRPVTGDICVSEAPYVIIHRPDQDVIEIPLKIFGNGTEVTPGHFEKSCLTVELFIICNF